MQGVNNALQPDVTVATAPGSGDLAVTHFGQVSNYCRSAAENPGLPGIIVGAKRRPRYILDAVIGTGFIIN